MRIHGDTHHITHGCASNGHLVSFSQIHIQTLLYYKERGVGLQRLAGLDQLEVVVSQNARNHLVDLEEGQVPANAQVGAAAELRCSSLAYMEDIICDEYHP